MPIIKLDAIDSTNDYLKQLSRESVVENYTIVMANEQTKGKGQMGAKWVSEKGKNLTMSVLIKDFSPEVVSVFDLNVAVAMAAVTTLTLYGISSAMIKWPNDIMAENKKVGGILIENSFKSDGTFAAVIGFGLNLNQTNFENLPQASSLTNVSGKTYDLDVVANTFVNQLKLQLKLFPENTKAVWSDYNKLLFKRNKAVAFEDKMGNRFMGIIKKVTLDGKLEVLLEDDRITHFEVKEVKMLY